MSDHSLAVLGFAMWIEYLRNCRDGDPTAYGMSDIIKDSAYIKEFYYKGNMPPGPEGPLKAALQGTGWTLYIHSVITHCRDMEKTKELFKLVNPDHEDYHSINALYRVLREAECSIFESKNPEENKVNMRLYVALNPSMTYTSFFVTLLNGPGYNPFRDKMKRNIADVKKLLRKYGCTYSLISKCQQEVRHIHGLLVFAWPVTIETVSTLLASGLTGHGREFINYNWDVQPVYTDPSYCVEYILFQEVERFVDYKTTSSIPFPITVKDLCVRKKEDVEEKLPETPMYYAQKAGFCNYGARSYRYSTSFMNYAKGLMGDKYFYKRSDDTLRRLERVFGGEALYFTQKLSSVTPGCSGFIEQKPILVIEDEVLKKQDIVDYLNGIKAPFRYIVGKFT